MFQASVIKANRQFQVGFRVIKLKMRKTLLLTFFYALTSCISRDLRRFCSKLSQIKIEKNQYRSLKLITNDYSNYKFLLIKTGNLTMEFKGLGNYALEIFKTLNNWDPILSFHERYMYFSLYSSHRKHSIFVHSRNTSNYGDKSVRAPGPHTWHSLSENIRSTFSVNTYKDLKNCLWPFLKNWSGPKC